VSKNIILVITATTCKL